jgi:hypothetical protein
LDSSTIEKTKEEIITNLKKFSEEEDRDKKDEKVEKTEIEGIGKRKRVENDSVDIASICYDNNLNELGDDILSKLNMIKIDFNLLIKYTQDRKLICKILKLINQNK